MLGEWNGRHWWSGARRGKMRATGEGRGGWAYGRSDVASIQGLAELHQIMRCFLLGLPLSKLILHLARTALCRRRTSRVPLLASARRMLTERARARAAAARVIVVGRSLRSLALPILAAPRAGLWFGCHQDDVVEWLQCVCGPRTPDTRRICAHRERETSQSHRSILRGNGREDAHGCHQDVRTAPHHRREARAPRARPASLVINRVQSTTLIASRCGGQVVQMHSWGASASRPSGVS